MQIRMLTVVCVAMACAAGAGAEAKHVYFGDTHLHSAISADAYLMGNRSADPDTAYRYAKGLPVVHPGTGVRVQIDVPLDFLAVSDHAEFLGVIPALFAGDARVGDSDRARRFLASMQGERPHEAFLILTQIGSSGVRDPGFESKDINAESWRKITEAADGHYEPGAFTTLVAWEWSSMPAGTGAGSFQGANLHRVVVMREGGEVARRFLPFSAFDSQRPEDLWQWLETRKAVDDASLLAIPHNSNIGFGRMFDTVMSDGAPIDAAYAQTRMRWEPVAEVTQFKGDSETHPFLSPDDEFADYELFVTAGQEPSPGDFVRSSMLRGLEIAARSGANPYAFGMIGASDSHTGLASVEETNYYSKWGGQSRPREMFGEGPGRGDIMGAAGLAAVWANENSREAIFDALKRREVYATTGTRLRVRFFGGFDFAKRDLRVDDPAKPGYRKGVPMGGVLESGEEAPRFLVHAEKDPAGANLDRIQVIKGWVDEAGQAHEKIFDVAMSDETRRRAGENETRAVGNTVDLETGRYTNDIGEPRLHAVWTDPEWRSGQRAFYYARVLEIPTPRHSLLDAIALGQSHPEDLPPTVQERAYTSPINLVPEGG